MTIIRLGVNEYYDAPPPDTNQGKATKGGVSGQMGTSSPQGRVAVYYGGGRPAAKSVSRSKPGTYVQWFGQKELIHPSGPDRYKKSGKSFTPEQTKQYQKLSEYVSSLVGFYQEDNRNRRA